MGAKLNLRGPLLLASILLATTQTILAPAQPDGQSGNSQLESDTSDLMARKTAFDHDMSDIMSMAESSSGIDQHQLLNLDSTVEEALLQVDATIGFLQVYYRMQCEPDRAIAKAALQNRIERYSQLLDLQATGVSRQLPLATLPAVAQAGARLRDDLRATKDRLDSIAVSLKSAQ